MYSGNKIGEFQMRSTPLLSPFFTVALGSALSILVIGTGSIAGADDGDQNEFKQAIQASDAIPAKKPSEDTATNRRGFFIQSNRVSIVRYRRELDCLRSLGQDFQPTNPRFKEVSVSFSLLENGQLLKIQEKYPPADGKIKVKEWLYSDAAACTNQGLEGAMMMAPECTTDRTQALVDRLEQVIDSQLTDVIPIINSRVAKAGSPEEITGIQKHAREVIEACRQINSDQVRNTHLKQILTNELLAVGAPPPTTTVVGSAQDSHSEPSATAESTPVR
jgi:hypothetical protein